MMMLRMMMVGIGFVLVVSIGTVRGSGCCSESRTRRFLIRGSIGIPSSQEPPKFMVMIYFMGEPYCSGSLISALLVLSTCQCVTDNGEIAPENFEITYAKHYVRTGFMTESVEIESVICHKNYYVRDDFDPSYDIALIKTKDRIFRSLYLDYVRLPAAGRPNFQWEEALQISSFKLRDSIGKVTLDDFVWFTNAQLVDNSLCDMLMGDNGAGSTARTLCTPYNHLGPTNKNCDVDVGGALTKENILVGILQVRDGCGQPGSYARYAKVEYFLAWINETISKINSVQSTIFN